MKTVLAGNPNCSGRLTSSEVNSEFTPEGGVTVDHDSVSEQKRKITLFVQSMKNIYQDLSLS